MEKAEGRPGVRLISRQEWRWVVLVSLGVTALAALPYIVNHLLTPAGYFYTGLIVNVQDGHSYLAKMRLGLEGNWLFRLSFTPEEQQGALLFTYYLLLGHVSRLLGLPLIAVYHLARSLGGIALLLVAYRFICEYFTDLRWRRFSFWIVALSSGLGWLAALFGVVAPDLWVPESNTFYSLLVNPHFPIMEALMYLVILLVASPLEGAASTRDVRRGRLALCAVCSALLAMVQPLAPFVLFPLLGAYLVAAARRERGVWARAIAAGLGALPFLAYYSWVFTRNPTIAAWTAQNATPAPAPWLMLIGMGLLLPPAIIAVVHGIRKRRWLLPTTWLLVAAALLYAPLPLQRRMTMGLHVPLAVLAALGLSLVLPRLQERPVLRLAIVILLLPTSLFLVLGGIGESARYQRPLFMTSGERQAMAWLEQHTSTGDLVLASPMTGLYIPAWAGNRVLFGHDFETIDAKARRAEVEAFFRASVPDTDLMRRYGVRYLFVGPEERARGLPEPGQDAGFALAYSNSDVRVYARLKGSEQ